MATTKAGPSASAEQFLRSSPWRRFWHGVIGRRRRFLINERYQFRVSLLGLGLVLLILVPLNLSFYFHIATTPEALAAAPELRDYMKGQDQAQFQLVLLASLVFLLGTFLISLLETHRTAGAAFNLGRHMEALGNGQYGVRLKLREGDNLRELEGIFNRTAQALCERTTQEIEDLETLADQIEKVHGEGAAREAASKVRMLGGRKKKLLE